MSQLLDTSSSQLAGHFFKKFYSLGLFSGLEIWLGSLFSIPYGWWPTSSLFFSQQKTHFSIYKYQILNPPAGVCENSIEEEKEFRSKGVGLIFSISPFVIHSFRSEFTKPKISNWEMSIFTFWIIHTPIEKGAKLFIRDISVSLPQVYVETNLKRWKSIEKIEASGKKKLVPLVKKWKRTTMIITSRVEEKQQQQQVPPLLFKRGKNFFFKQPHIFDYLWQENRKEEGARTVSFSSFFCFVCLFS